MLPEEAAAIDKGVKMKKLLANPEFKSLILEEYIQNQALDVGTAFSGDEADVDTLKAISGLNVFIQGILGDAERVRV